MTMQLWLRPAHHYTRLRIGALGPVPGPAGELVDRDLLAEDGQRGYEASDPGVDLVLVPGAGDGGPARLSGAVLDALIRCERYTVPTVLVAAGHADLDTPVAAVCRDIAGTDAEVLGDARRRFGSDRVHHLPEPAGRRVPGGSATSVAGQGRARHRRRYLPLLKALARGVGLFTPRSPLTSLRTRLGLSGRMRHRCGTAR
ncbi:hypothetical protein SAMN06265360_1019 [Haloechinothrix alba]|uniref:Uncharacterized protein n=1 Tax=Haloechinothrix alba TaxID=664784 RepID=A0A238UYE7_9PSEU|nr:hypothetical protein [Haloechinothrix alba]SNR27018.1 hypothetical protein SAMN06265360_1019 [Haloechinothrix alba]